MEGSGTGQAEERREVVITIALGGDTDRSPPTTRLFVSGASDAREAIIAAQGEVWRSPWLVPICSQPHEITTWMARLSHPGAYIVEFVMEPVWAVDYQI